MKQQHKRSFCAAAAMVLCLCMALGVMGMGFAKWQTTLTASGSVSVAGKWDLAVTDASIKTSSGAAVSLPFSGSLVRANQKEDWEIAGRLTDAYTWLDDDSAVGTQSDRKPASYDAIFYAVNTEKFDLSDSISYEKGEAIKADANTLHLSDYLNLYYRYYGDKAAFGSEQMSETATRVVDGFLRDAAEVLRQQYPDTWQQYAIVSLTSSSQTRFVVATVAADETPASPAVIENGSVSFADVTFGLPGAWASYTVTVTNNGTVNANLAGAAIALDTQNPEQLTLNQSDLIDETLAPGESCTLTFVLQVPQDYIGELNATGTLTVTLPYAQDTVEPAPAAAHTHA